MVKWLHILPGLFYCPFILYLFGGAYLLWYNIHVFQKWEEIMDKPVIGTVKLDGWAVLAPMAGVSDLAYRVIARRFGAAMTTAEMVSAKGLYYKNKKTEDMLKIDADEHPVALQLFGSDPEIMALGAREMAKAGPDIIDIKYRLPDAEGR